MVKCNNLINTNALETILEELSNLFTGLERERSDIYKNQCSFKP